MARPTEDAKQSAQHDSTVGAVDERSNLSHRQILVILSTLVAGTLLATLNTTLVSVALPTIVADLNGLDSISWVLTAYLLAATAVTPLYGKLSDLYGRVATYQASIVIFGVGSLLCGLATSMGQLIAFRVVQGVGGGGLLVGTFTIMGEVVSARERGRYLPYIQFVNASGVLVGPALGGLLVSEASWRWVFLLNVPIAIVAVVVVTLVLRLPWHRVETSIDVMGSVLLVGAIVCVLLAVNWGGSRYSWTSTVVLGLLVGGSCLFALLVLQERRARDPIVSFDLLRNGVVRTSSLFVFVFAIGTVGSTIIVFNQYVQVVLNFEPSHVWILILPFAAMSLVTGLIVGRVIAARGRYKIFPILGAAIGVVALCVFTQLGGTTPSGMFAVASGVLGIALGLAQQVPVIAAQNAVERDELGTATGTLQFSQQLGFAIGAAVFGSMYATRLVQHAERLARSGIPRDVFLAGREAVHALPAADELRAVDAYAHSIAAGYRYAVVVVAVALVVACFLEERPLRDWSFAGREATEQRVEAELVADTALVEAPLLGPPHPGGHAGSSAASDPPP